MSKERQELNRNLAQMLKGGVIMDVTTPEQAKIAEDAGACAFTPSRSESLPALLSSFAAAACFSSSAFAYVFE